ncbi:MAG TPA: flagellar assembly protein FliH [Clostridium sp.]|jgi:flagellar assembly protein FliH|uniref:Flagellar assembly protein FliH n=1 Tax=Clostridium lapidicellarium TaxID=3240931 RepID=A0ABV4DTQ1_9CLOT|nr:flagellar assembly protein FliH [uncultured Clostridium sp.]NLU08004.1 flagellar assembly protein FliH [Clostridiales bacterium]HBC95887.1 flagellar assembly protein FliH [Clostridium sp.]
MQSSYKIIKGDSIDEEGTQNIVTVFKKHSPPKRRHKNKDSSPSRNNYDSLLHTMMEKAAEDRKKIILRANDEAEEIKKKAYDAASKKGYEEGRKKGRDAGFKSAYDEGYVKNVKKAEAEGEDIRNKASAVLKNAVDEKKRYLTEKEEEIKKFIVNAVESVLKDEVRNKDSLNKMVFDALSQVKNSKTFIIKSRGKYCGEFKKQVDMWKEQLPFRGDIFVISDESLKDGSVVIERDRGKIILSVDIAMKKLREIFDSTSN